MTRSRLASLGVLLIVAGCTRHEVTPPTERLLTPVGAHHPTSEFSPDGKRVAYWAAGPAAWELRVANADLSESRVLASALRWERPLLWSPDGRMVAFTSDAASFADVWVVPADSGEAKRVTTGAGSEFPDQWHPKGGRLAFAATEQGGVYRTSVVDVARGTTTPMLQDPQSSIGVWSPDGSRIAYVVFDAGKSTIWLADSSGANPKQLTSEGLEGFEGTGSPWSPDGSTILYVSRRTGTGDIWALPVDGGAPRQLTHDVRDDVSPAWSPDGNWIAFVSNRGRQTDVWVMPAAGGQEIRVTDDEAGESDVQWVGGSTTLAFHTGIGTGTLSVLSLADGSDHQITPDSIRITTFDISPDGKEIVYGAYRGGGVGEIQVMPINGGPARVLVTGGTDNGDPYWSPDGKQVVFFSNRSGSGDLWVVDASGGEPRTLTSWPTDEGDAEWSADGKQLYFLSGREAVPFSDLWVVSAAGGEPRRLTRSGAIQNVEPSRGGNNVFITGLGKRAGQIVLSALLPDGSLRTLWDKSNVSGLSHRRVSPSGDSLVVQVEQPGGGFASILLSARTGASRPILDKFESAGPWSPDGKQLLYYFGNPAADLGVLNFADGSTRRLTDTPASEGSTMWTPDSKAVVVLRSSPRRRIATVDLASLLARAR